MPTDKTVRRFDNTARTVEWVEALHVDQLQTSMRSVEEEKWFDQSHRSESRYSMCVITAVHKPSQLAVPTLQPLEEESIQLSDSTVLNGFSNPSLPASTPLATHRLNASEDVATKPVDIRDFNVSTPHVVDIPLNLQPLDFSQLSSSTRLIFSSSDATQPPTDVTFNDSHSEDSSSHSTLTPPPPPPRLSDGTRVIFSCSDATQPPTDVTFHVSHSEDSSSHSTLTCPPPPCLSHSTRAIFSRLNATQPPTDVSFHASHFEDSEVAELIPLAFGLSNSSSHSTLTPPPPPPPSPPRPSDSTQRAGAKEAPVPIEISRIQTTQSMQTKLSTVRKSLVCLRERIRSTIRAIDQLTYSNSGDFDSDPDATIIASTPPSEYDERSHLDSELEKTLVIMNKAKAEALVHCVKVLKKSLTPLTGKKYT